MWLRSYLSKVSVEGDSLTAVYLTLCAVPVFSDPITQGLDKNEYLNGIPLHTLLYSKICDVSEAKIKVSPHRDWLYFNCTSLTSADWWVVEVQTVWAYPSVPALLVRVFAAAKVSKG